MTCSAEGYRFLSSNTIDKNVQEIFQIPTVRSDRTRALFNSLHGGGPIRGFVGGLRCGVSTPSFCSGDPKRMRAVVLAWLPSGTAYPRNAIPPQSYSRIPLEAC